MMGDHGRDGYAAEEDRLPWLEPVEEELPDEGVSASRLIAGLVVALVALGLVVGGVYWLKQRATGSEQASAGSASSNTIEAPAAPYKVKPSEPGGMQVKGQNDSSYAASEGADVNGQIDLNAAPETPIAKGKPAQTASAKPAAPEKAPAAAPTPVKTAAATPPAKPAPAPAPAVTPPAAAPATGGAQIQLGAVDSEAAANAVWKKMSGRFSYLAGLTPSITKAEVNGKTFYRLRAAASNAGEICGKLKVAGESCLVVK